MVNKAIEAGLVYLEQSSLSVDLFEDLDSLVLFLNTNEFTPIPLHVDDVEHLVNKAKKMSESSAKKILSKNQEQILERYLSLYEQLQTIPSLDEELTAFESELDDLKNQSVTVNAALNQPGDLSEFYNPFENVKADLDLLSEKEQMILEKQEALFNKEKELTAKESIISESILSVNNPKVSALFTQLDDKIMHLNALRNEHRHFENSLSEIQSQYEARHQQFELAIKKLTSVEADLKSSIQSKQKEFDKLTHEVFVKSKDLRKAEKTLLQTNKKMSKLGEEFQKRDDNITLREKSVLSREQEVEDSWEKLNELKHEVIAKQHKLAKHEVELEQRHDYKEKELANVYTQKIKELDREYKDKLKTLEQEFDSLSVKKEHIKRQEEQVMSEKQLLQKERKEIKLLKTKYQLQLHNNLDEVKSVRTHTVKNHTHHKPVPKEKPVSFDESDALSTIRALLDVATSEISLNPQLAKRTYKRVHELYQKLQFAEQSKIHSLIVKTHKSIGAALKLQRGGAND